VYGGCFRACVQSSVPEILSAFFVTLQVLVICGFILTIVGVLFAVTHLGWRPGFVSLSLSWFIY
jgi:hypothetical protein